MRAAIGVDPSMTATGIADAAGALLTVKYDKGTAGDHRLKVIYDAVRATVNFSYNAPLLAAVEDLPTHAHGAGITGMVQGVTRLALIACQLPYVTVPPATLKKFATGKGNANKATMRMELYKRAGLDITDDNQADAWWLRALALQLLDNPAVKLPAANLAALDKLTLPAGVR